MQFIEKPASERSLSRRRLIYGVGVNDAEYAISNIIDGNFFACHFYQTWKSMIERCFSKKYQKKYPSYINCTMDESWLVFSNFKAWMIKQEWQGKELDKDILIQGNKHYSPKACLFVTNTINSLLLDCGSSRGKYKLGVSFDKRRNNFKSRLKIKCKEVYLGCFDTEEEASEAYKKAKYKYIKEIAIEQDEPLRSALLKFKLV